MKIYIADDERLVRAGLLSMLKEVKEPVEIVGEAANGVDLIEGIQELQPDVAFVDIKMPKLNGLEAIRLAKEASPLTKWVILTGFAEFNYAQEALKLGVSNYLLKPISPEDLEKTIKELHQQHKKVLKFKNKEFENDMIALFHGLTTFDHLETDFFNENTCYFGSVYYLDSHLDEKAKAEQFRTFLYAVQRTVLETTSLQTRTALFPLPNGEVTAIICWNDQHEQNKERTIEEFQLKMEKRIKDFNHNSLSITMICTGVTTSFDLLKKRIEEIEKYASLRTLYGIGKILTITNFPKDTSKLEGCLKLIDLADCFTERRFFEYANVFDKLKDYQEIFNEQVIRFLQVSLGCNIPLKEPFAKLRAHGEQALAAYQKKESKPMDFVARVTAYIDQHYMEDLGVGTIAEELGVTPNYLSALFKKKTGTTFIKYLTNTRLLKAKELLLEHNAQVQDVAQKVGYYSTRHFSKLFKEAIGCYPSDYKNRSHYA